MSHGPELDHLAELLHEQPGHRCFAALADGLRKHGQYDEAIAVAREGTEREPGYVPGWIALARIAWEQHNVEDTAEAARRALAIDPDHALARELLQRTGQTGQAQSETHTGDSPDEAFPTDESAIAGESEHYPDPIREDHAIHHDAAAAPGADEEVAAVPTVDHTINGSDAESTFSEMDQQPNEFEPPVDDADIDLDAAVDDAVYTESLAMLYWQQGHLDDALTVMDAMVARMPDNRELAARRDAWMAEANANAPPPAASTGPTVRQWLASIAAVKQLPARNASSYDAFYQPLQEPDEAGDLAAFQAWLKELGR